ncbi:putative aldehyde oxidase Art an 7 [Primulina eburnea]|uniref:putative aldehyde oxidase Art an 7 n=1 Tax=Primulina eburnea TaxID=1245227 RepID=UPI003C6C1A3F
MRQSLEAPSMANLLKTLVLFSLLVGCTTARISSVNHDESGGTTGYGEAPHTGENENGSNDPPYSQNTSGDDDRQDGEPEPEPEPEPEVLPKNPNHLPEEDGPNGNESPSLFPKLRFPFFSFFGNPWNPGKGEEDEPENAALEEGEPGAEFLGSWMIHSEDSGVSAMHIQLLPNNKAVWYDTTTLGLSDIEANPRRCKPRVGGRNKDPKQDCTAHAIEYDVETAEIRTLKMTSDPWCSSGALSPKGALISTGGNQDGFRSIRILEPCDYCDFKENDKALIGNRWYATQHALENGSFVLIGGRASHNYEIFAPDQLESATMMFGLPLLAETNEMGENNLYPFVNLLPDGNLFVFANYKSIILNPYTGETVRTLPDLPGGTRNYPPSGMSALLPIDLNKNDDEGKLEVEVIICGGNTRDSFEYSDMKRPRKFFAAFKDCGRLNLNKKGSNWEKEDMPSPRVMGDLLLLPTGDVLIINGAKAGTSAWNAADIPNLNPVLYSPNKIPGQRFKELVPTKIARMYHSSSAVLPDGQILVAGSNTNPYYMHDKARDPIMIYPTDLRVEKFSPPYLAPALKKYRLVIVEDYSDKKLKYGDEVNIHIQSDAGEIDYNKIKVTMYSPPFTTHGYSMNQRLLILKLKKAGDGAITVVAPPSGRLAPPGYYLLFVVHQDVPSRGMWVHIE